ncbi:hypothetical protein OO009_08300 [Flavobacteriaceae bacterium KMM 6897]|nr:hypothetical protein [Flavobacteriaceae bacterium KMM 6897]MEB8345693.1 hypothetical protein [Flavobacteriaceae bacterium KMM 6898]
MFLRAITDKFKHKSGQKFLKRELGKAKQQIGRSKGVSSIGCIVNLDQFDDIKVFNDLVNIFSLQPNAVQVIGYREEYHENSPYATPMFSDRDLGWRGAIQNGYAQEFLSKEFDLLINYYTEDKLLLQLMTVQTKARINVGFGEVDKNLNDLILNTSIQDYDIFTKELRKYLFILNEIK